MLSIFIELYDFSDLGIPKALKVQSGRIITVGEYSGVKGFRFVCNEIGIEFQDDKMAQNYLELARYANVHTQKPLTLQELAFIMMYPVQAAKIITVIPFNSIATNHLDSRYREIFPESTAPKFRSTLDAYFSPTL